MIKYALKCSHNHGFESWFKSADAFEKLSDSGLVVCPACASTKVTKAIMAPKVQTKRCQSPKASSEDSRMHALTAPASKAELALAELKKKIQDNSEYVGEDFASEARAIYEGEAPERSIYGEAKSDEARALIDDGVPVAPLPFTPSRKTN